MKFKILFHYFNFVSKLFFFKNKEEYEEEDVIYKDSSHFLKVFYF